MTYSEKTLSLMREANIHEFVELLNFFWEKNMTYEERKEAFTVRVGLLEFRDEFKELLKAF